MFIELCSALQSGEWDCDNISRCHGRSSVQSITLQGAARDVALAVIVAIPVMAALILVIVASRPPIGGCKYIHKNHQEKLLHYTRSDFSSYALCLNFYIC